MMVNPIARLSANNAAFNMMNAADSLCSFKGNSKSLELGMLNDSFIYKAALQMEKTQKKLSDANIKRTFSVIV